MNAANTRLAVQDRTQFPVVKATPLVVPVLLRFDPGVTWNVNQINTLLLDCYGRGFARVGQVPSSGGAGATWGQEGRPVELAFYDLAKALDNGRPATEFIPNIGAKNAVNDVAAWTVVAGATITRSTAQHLFGAASTRIQTPGGAANEGGYILSGPAPLTGDVNMGGYIMSGGSNAGNVRPYIAEYDPTNTNLVGKTNGTSIAVPGSWTAIAAFNRTGVVKGNVLRIGIETTATAADDFHLAGLRCTSRSTLFPGAPDVTTWDGGGKGIEMLLKFHNQDFYADLLYDALDNAFPTVYSDKDELSQGALQFAIGP